MRIDRLGALGSAAEVLRAVAASTARNSLPPPAALTGEWFGSRAVIVPTLNAEPVDRCEAFAVPTGARSDAIGGGWLGYLSYPDPGADDQGPRIPDAAGGWTDCVLRCDRDGVWWYESLSGAVLSDWLRQAFSTPPAPSPELSKSWRIDWTPPDQAAHRAGVLECLEAIAAGEVYQACVCTRFTATVRGSTLEFFADAVTHTAPARAAYLGGAWGAVASLSPELFLSRHGATVTSSPIKGTLPLQADPAALRHSAKDVAENIMIVDLVRNDLSRVAVTGSVTVPDLLSVQAAPGVWHLESTVCAQVRADMPVRDVLEATFPPASVTGTPKGRARELLTQWETHRRGVYCGTVGLASPVAGTELNVAIRTVEFDNVGNAVLGVGGGITADSDPDAEWHECLHKAAPTVSLTASERSVHPG